MMLTKPAFRTAFLGALLGSVLLLYGGILYRTQILQHDYYTQQSERTIATSETINAARGVITDRNGKVLVTNRSTYAMTFDASRFSDDAARNKAVARLTALLRSQGISWTDSLPISRSAPFTYTLPTDSTAGRSRLFLYLVSLSEAKRRLGDYLSAHPEEVGLDMTATTDELIEAVTAEKLTPDFLAKASLSANDVMGLMRSAFGIDEACTDLVARDIAGIRYELALRSLGTNTAYVMAEDLSPELITMLSDGNFEGAKVIASTEREYRTSSAAHILGSVSRIWAEELADLKEKGYDGEDWIGRDGVEAAFEDYLRGIDGRRVVSTNTDGKITGVYYTTESQPGNTVALTLDIGLQETTEAILRETVESMNAQDGLETRGAGAAIIRIGTGEVLALPTCPTYDPATYRSSINELSADPAAPLFNRATQGRYPPGSTFKMLTAVAALEEGVVTASETVRDTGRWYYPDMVAGAAPWGAWCWNHSGHGRVNVIDAIRVSCNYFFYEMGYRLGIDRIDQYAEAFGLGQKTGIEISEDAGVLASPANTEAHGGVWYGGNTVMAAIGQSDHLFTPLQLANYIATLVDGGNHRPAHLLKEVRRYDNSGIVAVGDTAPMNIVPMSEETRAAVMEGMRQVATVTLKSSFKDCIVTAGAKTGTAQVNLAEKNNGVFVCFAPYEDPEIALALVIEKGGSGSALASTAVRMLNAYFEAGGETSAVTGENTLMP